MAAAALGQNVHDFRAMGAAPCAWSQPVQKADKSLDVPKTIALLKTDGFTCHAMPIENAPPYTWDEFQRLLAAADAAGIDEWPVLIPPTEGYSAPYKHDFVAWMRVFAKLSRRYPHLRGVNIDDLDQDENVKLFSRDYVCRIYSAKQAINPKLSFVPTIYELDQAYADRLSGCVDGIWLWWKQLDTAAQLSATLRSEKAAAAGRFPVYGGVYAHSTSWHKAPVTPSVFKQTLEQTCRLTDGAVIWNLTLEAPDPLLRIAETFTHPGGAARCGSGPPKATADRQ
ncbi:MAG: hypothetical protein ACR2NN_28325 [Bryobacteraceae bacterium]